MLLGLFHVMGLFIKNPSGKENLLNFGQLSTVLVAFPVIWICSVMFVFFCGPFESAPANAILVPTNSMLERGKLLSCKVNLERIIPVALEKYASNNNGKYPEKLYDIIPGYLKEVSVCPAGGMYVYRKEKGDYILVCSGEAHKNMGIKGDYPRFTHLKGLECPKAEFSDFDLVKVPLSAYALVLITLILSVLYINNYVLNRFFIISTLISAGVCVKYITVVFINVFFIPLVVFLYISYIFSRCEAIYAFYRKRGDVKKAVFWLAKSAKLGKHFNRSSNIEANFYLGKVYGDSDEKDAAFNYFSLVLEENPQHPCGIKAREEMDKLRERD